MGPFFCGRVLLVFGMDDGGLVAMGGWRIQVKMLDGKLFDGDEMEIHGGGLLGSFLLVLSLGLLASRRIMALYNFGATKERNS